MKTGMVSALAFFSILGAVGCGGAAEGADPAAAPKDEAPTTFERTIVHVASGKATVTTEKIDADEQLVRAAAMKEPTARANDGVGTTSSALIQVTSCNGYVMYLFDQPGYKGNEICFVGNTADLSAPVDLSQYQRMFCGNWGCWFGGTWAGAVRSFYTAIGGDFSSLGDWYVGDDGLWHRAQNVEYFQPFDFVAQADGTVQAATSMNLFPVFL